MNFISNYVANTLWPLSVIFPLNTVTGSENPVRVEIEAESQFGTDVPIFSPAILLASVFSDCPRSQVLGLQVSGNDGDQQNGLDINLDYNFSGALRNGVSVIINKSLRSIRPSVGLCSSINENQILHVEGSMNTYAFAFTNVSQRRKAMAQVSLCDTLIIESQSATTIELPVALKASAVVAESFGAPDDTFGRVTANFSGTIGSTNLNGGSLSIESVSVIPETAEIDLGEGVELTLAEGENYFQINIIGEFVTESKATSAGLFGLISGSATAGITLPGSFDIGIPTGLNGSPLPRGIRVASKSTGEVIVDTMPIERIDVNIRFQNNEPILSWTASKTGEYEIQTLSGSAWKLLDVTPGQQGENLTYKDLLSADTRIYRIVCP